MKIISCDHYCEKLWGKNNNMARKNIKNITHLWTLLLAVLCSVCPQHIDYILVIMKDLQSIGTSQNQTNLEFGLATPYFGNAYELFPQVILLTGQSKFTHFGFDFNVMCTRLWLGWDFEFGLVLVKNPNFILQSPRIEPR